jgi:hypothetical protein
MQQRTDLKGCQKIHLRYYSDGCEGECKTEAGVDGSGPVPFQVFVQGPGHFAGDGGGCLNIEYCIGWVGIEYR